VLAQQTISPPPHPAESSPIKNLYILHIKELFCTEVSDWLDELCEKPA